MQTEPTAEGTAPAVEAPAAAAPAPAAPVATPEPPATAALDPMDAALASLVQQKTESESAANPAPAATETPEPEPAKPEGELPPVEPKTEKVLPNRVHTAQFSDTEQQAIALGKALKDAGEPVPSLKERIEIIEARQKPAPAAAATEPEPEPDSALSELDQKLEAARARKKELAKSLGTEELDAAQDEIAELTAQKAAIEGQKAKADSAKKTAFGAARAKSIEAARKQFPSSADPKSEIGQAFAARLAEIKADPQRAALLNDPKAPEIIIAEVVMDEARLRAADNNTSVATELAALMEPDAPAKAAAPATTPPPAVRKPTTAGGAASIPPAAPPPQRPPTLAEAANMSLEDLEKLLPTPKRQGFVLRT